MVFNSLTFALFFIAVLVLHNAPLSWPSKKLILLVSSYLFYAGWHPPFVLLLLTSTVVDWYSGKAIYAATAASRRKRWLALSILTNLSLLGFFKYGDFLIHNIEVATSSLGFPVRYEPLGLILPVGISFYTFQTLSYTLDIYRGTIRPARSPIDFALFVSFFPQLVAGPIVRARDFLPQCETETVPTRWQLGWGVSLLMVGLLEKDIADYLLAPVADSVFSSSSGPGFRDAWIGTLAFSGQIFFDFAGYSTCAIGVALCLGFVLPDNFRFPYAAIGFSDFWRRWHISLSGWLRDYLYISLGGNRRGRLRTYVNLMLTMLIGGLWHGAGWTYVVWGGIHGMYLCIERLVRPHLQALHLRPRTPLRLMAGIVTFLCVCVTWVFFRAQTFVSAYDIVAAMLGLSRGDNVLPARDVILVLVITCMLLAGHWALRDSSLESLAQRLPWWARGAALAATMLLIILLTGDDRAFIYFQF